MVIACRDDDHPGQTVFFRRPHRNAIDVESPAAEQAGDPLQYAGLVIDQDGNRMPAARSSYDSPINISSIVLPCVTIGYTFSSFAYDEVDQYRPRCVQRFLPSSARFFFVGRAQALSRRKLRPV